MAKKKLMPIKSLYKSTWTLFSEYIRRRDKGICFTCKKSTWDSDLGENNWKIMNAGHYKHGVLDFDEMNIQCQCVRCNKWLSGNLAEYTMFLIKKYGIKKVEELHERIKKAKKGKKYSREELLDIKSRIQRKLKALDD